MLRLALIGHNHETERYLAGARRVPGVAFTALVDDRSAEQAARQWGVPTWAKNLDTLLAEHADAFDAVLIGTSAQTGPQQIRSAAGAGKHVLVHAPLGLNVESVDGITAACEDAHVHLMVAHSIRFLPSVLTVKASLDAGELGDPGLLRIHHWSSTCVVGWPAWTQYVQSNGSIVFSPGTHAIDLANWFFGQMPSHVYATGHTTVPGAMELADYVQIHLGFPQGGMALIVCATRLPRGEPYDSMSLIGSKGSAYADDHHNMHLLFQGNRPVAQIADRGEQHVIGVLQEFGQAIEEEREPCPSAAAGRAAVQVAEAALRSLQSRRALTLVSGEFE